MSKADIIQTNFTAGEISKRLLGRVDIDKYRNGAETVRNCYPLIHGGLKTLECLRYNGAAKNADKKCRLIRFEFSKTEANIIELGDQYIRIWNADRTQVMSGGFPYEISTIFLEAELFEIDYYGRADTLFFYHKNHPTQRLRRFAVDNWVIDDAPFDPEPFSEQGFKPSATLTLSSAAVGSGRTFTAGASALLEADVGRRITYNGGIALITGFTSNTIVTCTIETAFDSTSIASGLWTITGTPQAICTPSSNGAIGETVDLDLTDSVKYETRQTIASAVFDGVATPPELDFTTSASHGYSAGDTVQIEACEPIEYNGFYELVSASGVALSVNYAPNPGAASVLGTVRKISATAGSINGWRSTDVGAHVEINGGLLEITAYVSATKVNAIVRQSMTSDASAQANAWVLKQSIFNSSNGYPRTGTIYQQAHCLGGSPAYPNSFAKSVVGEVFNFELGTDDDKAFFYDLDVEGYDPILHMRRLKRQLVFLNARGYLAASGGVEKPITPTNVNVSDPINYGCNDVRPAQVGNELIYVNRTGKKVRSVGYKFDSDSFDSADLTKLAEHITGNGVVDIAYQQEPESIVWMCREDGALLSMTIDRVENVIGWASHTTPASGEFESVAVIPNSAGVDELWCVVKRTINGSTVRYIESFDTSLDVSLHSAISGTTATNITGLGHLEAASVYVVADGAVLGPYTVSSAQITLPRQADVYQVGLFQGAYVKTLNPEIVTQAGSSQGNNTKLGKIICRLKDSYNVKINGQYIDKRTFGSGLLDQPPPVFTGDIKATSMGWKPNNYTEIEQATPLPMQLLAVIYESTVNN